MRREPPPSKNKSTALWRTTCASIFMSLQPRIFGAVKQNRLALKNTGVSWAYEDALWTRGTANPDDTLEAFSHYKLAAIADRISQDVLILAGTEDHFIPFHQVADFEESLVNAAQRNHFSNL